MLHFLTFALSHFVNVCTPGPGFLLITENSIIYGKKTAIKTLAILHISYTLQMFFVFLSIYFGFSKSKYLTASMHIGSFLFLLYFAFRILKNKEIAKLKISKVKKENPLSFMELFPSTIIYGLLNIKALSSYFIFIGVIAPENLRYLYGIWIITMSFIYNCGIIHFFTIESVRIQYIKHNKTVNKIAATLLVILAFSILKGFDLSIFLELWNLIRR